MADREHNIVLAGGGDHLLGEFETRFDRFLHKHMLTHLQKRQGRGRVEIGGDRHTQCVALFRK